MQENKQRFIKTVNVFLADLHHLGKITWDRAEKIAQNFFRHINLLDEEEDFLKLIEELSKDFEELHELTVRIKRSIHADKRRQMENNAREFAIFMMTNNARAASDFLKEVLQEGVSEDYLSEKFPEYGHFLQKRSKPR